MCQPGSWNAAFRASREGELASCRSTLLHERSSVLADSLKRHFEATKFVRTQFREHSLHLRGMLSKGRSNEVLAARGEATIRTRRSSALSTRLTRPFATRRS